MNLIKQQVIAIIDDTMPGYRIGGPPRPDYATQVKRDLERYWIALLAHDTRWVTDHPSPFPQLQGGCCLNLASVQAFVREQSLPSDKLYVRAFRQLAILRLMAETEAARIEALAAHGGSE